LKKSSGEVIFRTCSPSLTQYNVRAMNGFCCHNIAFLDHLDSVYLRPEKKLHGCQECQCISMPINPLNPKLNPICYLLTLLGAHHFLHVSRIRVKSLTFRRLMSYIYGAPILDVSRSHTTTQHSR